MSDATANGGDSRQTSRILLLSFGVLAFMAMLAVGATALVLEIQAGARAYVLGNNYWTAGRQSATYFLYLYTDRGDPEYLARAREALQVPLADRRARLALDERPPELEIARHGFLAGGNAPEDVPRLIRIYRYFGDTAQIRRAIEIWAAADEYIVRLSDLAGRMEHALAEGPLTDAEREAFQDELIRIDRQVRPVERAFVHQLSAGASWLSHILIMITSAVFMLMTAIALAIYGWLLRRIRATQRDFRSTFEQAAVGMAQLSSEGRFLSVNATLCHILQTDRKTLNQHRPQDLMHPDERFGDPWQLSRLLSGELESYSAENRYLRGDGEIIWGKVTVSAVRGDKRRPDRVLAVLEDVTESRRLAEALSYQASHDKLTGLFNRHETEERLQRALDSARTDNVVHGLLFIDLDQFKVVNDTCGHVAGDHLLCQLASLLGQNLRETDTVGRLGGDEFGIILNRTTSTDAHRLAERLRRSVSELAFHWEGRSFTLTVSIGMVEITRDVPDVTWLLSAADTACYLAKDQGRNRVHTYSETDEAVTERRGQMEWVSDIRQAIQEDRLRVFAQFIEPLAGQPGLHYELLVRLVDRSGQEYAPGSFLPAAERYDLASAIDRWMLATAFDQFAAHPEHLEALSLCHINVSAQSITDLEFLHFVEAKLDEGVVPGEKLCFEITETAAMTSLQDAIRFIDAVQARGCSMALDDFGSGLSSFGYLKHLPVDLLKIDGIFVRDMANDPLDRAIVESIHGIGKALGKRTIAEFVETRQVADVLREMGVDFAQGYGVHRPCPLAEILAGTDTYQTQSQAPRRRKR